MATSAPMRHPRLSSEEIVRLGKEIYEHDLRQQVEPENVGRFLVVDVETKDYEIDDEDVKASLRLLERHPGAALFGLRIGYPAAYRLGGPLRGAR